jgi:hypothetical protein
MKRRVSFFALYLIASAAFSQEKTTISAESARKDLTLLYTSLLERHPGAYRHTTPAEVKGRFDEALSAANRNLSFWEFYRIASRLNRTFESISQHRDLEVEHAMKWLSDGN